VRRLFKWRNQAIALIEGVLSVIASRVENRRSNCSLSVDRVPKSVSAETTIRSFFAACAKTSESVAFCIP